MSNVAGNTDVMVTDLYGLLSFIRRMERNMPTATKPAKKPLENKSTKATTKDKKSEAVEDKKAKNKAAIKNSKTIVKGKAETKGKEKPAAKAKSYTPQKNSMRYFVLQALKRGGSSRKIKSRAAALAAKAGVEKYSESTAFKGFDISFFVGVLRENGFTVTEDGNKFKLAA
jgi:hypothetical protein